MAKEREMEVLPGRKICPFMSSDHPGSGFITCREHNCMAWVEIYTTKGLTTHGCIRVLGPQMVDGQLRV